MFKTVQQRRDYQKAYRNNPETRAKRLAIEHRANLKKIMKEIPERLERKRFQDAIRNSPEAIAERKAKKVAYHKKYRAENREKVRAQERLSEKRYLAKKKLAKAARS